MESHSFKEALIWPALILDGDCRRVDTGFDLIFRLSRDHIVAMKEYLKTCLVGNSRRRCA